MNLPSHTILEGLREQGALNELDIRFAGLMAELASATDKKEVFLAAALTSRATRDGNICLELERAEETVFPEGRPAGIPPFPSAEMWASLLRETTVVGTPGDFTPLVLDEHNRLYLHKFRAYQDTLARWIRHKASQIDTLPDIEVLRNALSRLFPSSGETADEPDLQKTAACAAVLRKLLVISGGPGTGKTTTIAAILALLQEVAPEGSSPLRIELAASTGKAAARLGEAVSRNLDFLLDPGAAHHSMPGEAKTIHRLLRPIHGSPFFRYDAEHPLPLDVLVVDEGSMVDLALMSKLVQALPDHARLIIVGDRDQLASVEPGSVLGDICGRKNRPGFSPGFNALLEKITGHSFPAGREPAEESFVRDCIMVLEKSYRFDHTSGLGKISRLVNEGDAGAAVSLLKSKSLEDIVWNPLSDSGDPAAALKRQTEEFLTGIAKETDPARALQALESYRILCALREGPYGTKHVNRMVERTLASKGLILSGAPWYAGRPVLIVRNDYGLRLFNGDVGIVLPEGRNGDLRAWFSGREGEIRGIHPMRLPEHETAFAMTVHKSQGSEFDRVLLILGDRLSPVLSRELLYTGITRARRFVEIWASEEALKSSISRRTHRSSGLEEAIWKVI